MDDTVLAIRESDVGTLSFEILDYSDRISEIFSKIDICMDNLSKCYEGESCTALKAYYKDLSSNYDVIKSNIISYSDDLIALVRMMNDTDKKIANLFEEFSADAKKETESIES